MEGFVGVPERLVIAALFGFAFLLTLIIKVKVQPVVALLVSAIFIGIASGMPPAMIIGSIEKGVGSTLQGIALLVGLGAMFGAILEVSGGAEQIASTLVNKFGEKKAPLALGITGLVVGIPVFFDAGLIILIPLALSIAKKTKKSVLFYSIPLLAGLAVGHAFIPPTPGPILVASLLKLDLGYLIGFGLLTGAICMLVAGPIFAHFAGSKIFVPVPETHLEISEAAHKPNQKLPSFVSIVTIILIPLFLILLNTVSKVIPALENARPILGFIGTPFIALIIAIIAAMMLMGFKHGYSRKELEKIMTKALQPVGLILLVTAGGGVIRWVIEDSGLGKIIGTALAESPLPLVAAAFLIALAVRVMQGSATVAMTLAAGLMAAMPETTGLSPIALTAIAIAIAGGATACSHVNDSGFWLVKSLFHLDEKTTLRTWTAMETIIGFTGFICAIGISFFG
jgi:GntP family gluconate:H+ symporter/Gnt-I system low-affinity gluconate transporter